MTTSNVSQSEQQTRQSKFVMAALDRYERPLTRYAQRLLGGDLATARDVVQHGFLKLCEQDHQTLEDRVAPWLYSVCRNRAIDLMRGRKREEPFDETQVSGLGHNGHVPDGNPARIIEEAEILAQIRRLIDDLPEWQQEIVELWSQGFTSQEVGEIIGKNSGAVRIALHRAVKQLRCHASVRTWLNDHQAPESMKSPVATVSREPR